MVYLSALVRRMLSRELGRLPKKLKRVIPDSFMPSHKTWTNWYLIKAGKAIARDEVQKAVARRDCENARRDDCDKKDEGDTVLGYLLLYMLFYPLVHSWIAVQDWLTVLYMRSKTEYTMYWYPTAAENLEVWQPRVLGNGIDGMQIRGVIVGRVQYIGPLSDEILASLNAKKR
jgi:hypothetical protein